MKKLLTIIFVIFLAALLGLFLKEAPGYVLLSYKSWVVELSLWSAIFILLLGFILTYKIISFIKALSHWPENTSHWLYKRKQNKIFNKTSRGLLKLAEGNFKEALNLLSNAAKSQKKPLINYLTAAKAAQELNQISKRDEFLRLAFECSPKSGLSIGLMQANLQFDNHEYEASLATLNNLVQKYGNNKVILRKLLKCFIKLKDWHNVVLLIPDLTRYNIYTGQEILDYEIHAAKNQFDHLTDSNNNVVNNSYLESVDNIDIFYNKELTKKARSNYIVIKAYINCLLELYNKNKNNFNQDEYLGLVDRSLSLIDKNTHNNSTDDELKELFELYGDIAYKEQHFKKFEKQIKHHEYNIDLLFNLGKLAIKLEDFDKAYQYLNQAQKLSADNTKVKYCLAFVLLKLDKQQQGYELFNQCFNIV